MTWPMQRFALVFIFSFATFACNQEELGPVAAPAANHPGYAAEYPSQLEGTVTLFDVERGWAKEFPAEFRSFPDALSDPDWELVTHVYELAEADARSAHYAEVRRKNVDVAAFFVEEKKELVAKVSGGVHYLAEKEGCDTKFYGAIDRGLEKGVEERFDEREEEASRAQRLIKRYEKHIGADNAATLKKQAKTISAAANLAYIQMAERHQKLSEMVGERGAVKKTIDRRLEQLKSSKPPEDDPAAKEALDAEIARLEKASAALDSAVESAESQLETSEEEIEAARSAFDEAVEALLDETRQRAKQGAKN